MIRTLLLLGPTDDQSYDDVSVSDAREGGRVMTAEFNGLLPILPFMAEDRLLDANTDVVIVGVNRIRLPANTRFNIFNLVGDADCSARMLHTIQSIANKVRPQRLFNRPSDVFKTSRTRLPNTLAGVARCRVPGVASTDAHNAQELRSACERFGRWPMILRSLGEHGGQNMILLECIDQLDEVADLAWLYDRICLIEFIDYKNNDGLYQKNRVIVVDGVPYPRHAVFSEKWMVHAGSRNALMNRDMALCRKEERFLENEVGKFDQVFKDMHQRIGLDVFGVDFALVDGEIVVFEANACMKFLDRTYRADNRFQYLNKRVRDIKRGIKKMLVKA